MTRRIGDDGKIGGWNAPYPGESAYSMASRRATVTLGNSQYRINCMLFGRYRKLDAYTQKPLPKDALERWGMDVSIEEYGRHVQEHSIYPLYAAALGGELQAVFSRLLKGEELSKSENLRIARRMGSKHLRKGAICYCPLCLEEEENLHGEPYWHILHQIQGVLCCPKHKVKLIAALPMREIQWAFIPAYWLLARPERPEPVFEENEDIIQMAQDIEWLLCHGFDSRVRNGYREAVAGIDRNLMLASPGYHASKKEYLDILEMGNPSGCPRDGYDPMNRPNYLSMVVFSKLLGRRLTELL